MSFSPFQPSCCDPNKPCLTKLRDHLQTARGSSMGNIHFACVVFIRHCISLRFAHSEIEIARFILFTFLFFLFVAN